MRKEIITIGVGQAGVQVSNAAWELYCMEHGIYADGTFLDASSIETESSYRTFFEDSSAGLVVPRAILCDLEGSVVGEVRTGAYRDLFHPESLLSGYEDAANNYARGHFTIGKKFLPDVMERLRKMAGVCENLEGFLIVNGLGGGTGSGMGDVIMEKLNTEFAKRTKVLCSVYPGVKYSTATVEPYNTLLSVHTSVDMVDVAMQFDNDAMYSICSKHLGQVHPTYSHLNRTMSQVLSSLTCAIRFDNYVDADLTQVQTNLVPYPKIHFPSTAFSPYYMLDTATHQNATVEEITRDALDVESQLASCDLSKGKMIAMVLQYRGTCSPNNVYTAITTLKGNPRYQFVDWCPTGIKTGICSQPSVAVPGFAMAQTERSVCILANSTAVTTLWQRLVNKFDMMFAKRAFVHWYVGEGMEEGEFMEARDKIMEICKDYAECGLETEKELEDVPDSPHGDDHHQSSNQSPRENASDGQGSGGGGGGADEEENDDSNQNNQIPITNVSNSELFTDVFDSLISRDYNPSRATATCEDDTRLNSSITQIINQKTSWTAFQPDEQRQVYGY